MPVFYQKIFQNRPATREHLSLLQYHQSHNHHHLEFQLQVQILDLQIPLPFQSYIDEDLVSCHLVSRNNASDVNFWNEMHEQKPSQKCETNINCHTER